MKKIILLLALSCLSVAVFAQTGVYLYATGVSGSYTTGSATSSTRTDDSIRTTSTTQNGYAVFDLSAIPAGSTITGCTLYFYVSSYTAGVAGLCNTYGYAGDLSTVTTPATLFSDISGGTLLFSATPPAAGSYGSAVGPDSASSSSITVNTFLQSNIGGKVSIGFTGGGTNQYTIIGETGSDTVYYTNAPILAIYYTPPCSGYPGAGYITPGVSSACSTSYDTLTYSYYSTAPGITFQWQSSPDSATWSNISGATNATYVIPGLTATTYYRCFNTCTNSGLSDTSAGVKITYVTTCCSGTPPVGVTTSSTYTCNSCSLTLGLSSYPAEAGLTYQWQISPDNITWSDMYGATTVPYTFSPLGTYYYRCMVTCAFSGLYSYSSSVLVSYDYHIIADSVTNPPIGTCDPPVFYTGINGWSPLLYVKTYYGDGTTDSVEVIYDTSVFYTNTPHSYYSSGVFSIKQVLYFDNIPQDSDTYNYTYTYCDMFFVGLYMDLSGGCYNTSTRITVPLLVQVDSAGIPIDTVSATSGLYYQAFGPVGTVYSFSVISSALSVTCPSSGILYDTSGANTDKYIGLNCTGSTPFDLAVYDVIPVTGAHDEWGNIYAYNNFCTSTDAIVTLHYSPKYNVEETTGGGLDVSPPPTSYVSSSISWNVTGISSVTGPVDLYYAIWSDLGCCGYLTPGDTVNSYVTITPVVGDADTSNNVEIIIDTVRAGCDPNNMSVTPAGCITKDTVTQLQYTISFMNTGNDTAFNIYVMDTLPSSVDPKSLRIILASTVMNISVFTDGTYNIAKFAFPGINLLDSAVCPHCSGAVIFNINTIPGLPESTTILNHAGIFFDYNPVVITNTVEDVMGGCSNIASVGSVQSSVSSVQIFPNPATNELTITMNQNAYSGFAITNSIGQEMIQQPLSATQTNVNIATLPSGLYYIIFRGDNGTSVQKFVKM